MNRLSISRLSHQLLATRPTLALMSQPRPQQSRGRGGKRAPGAGVSTTTIPAKAPAHTSAPQQTVADPNKTLVAPTVSTHLSNVSFDSLRGRVDERLLSAIPFPLMSEVQAATLGPALEGHDLLARAKTGTGKTIAFLLPTLNRILNQKPSAPANRISCLVMSPTRELALQIEKETEMLLKNIGGQHIGVQHVVGGTNMKAEETKLNKQRCDILIATPGRLLDHLTNSRGIAEKFSALQVYILDEADRMLDMGFRQELAKIGQFLPNRRNVPRQALLFSATIPAGIREVADLDANAQYIDTLGDEEDNTHAHVAQQFVVAPKLADVYPLTLALLLEELKASPDAAKVIVFAPTARAAGLAAELFRSKAIGELLQDGRGTFTIGEVHSRKSQAQRVKATKEFAETRRGVLFSSDVAARGIDFPGVTAVFQAGLPASPDQYIHRIGRTGRAGAQGHSVIVLASFESYFLQNNEMKGLPLSAHPEIPAATLNTCRSAVQQGLLNDVADESKAQAYAASLGYYKSELRSLRWNADRLVQEMNVYASDALLYNGGSGTTPPPLLAKTVGKMGLKGVSGLNIVRELPGAAGGSGGRGGGAPGAGGARGGARGRGGPRPVPSANGHDNAMANGGPLRRANPEGHNIGQGGRGGGNGGRGGGRGGSRGGRGGGRGGSAA